MLNLNPQTRELLKSVKELCEDGNVKINLFEMKVAGELWEIEKVNSCLKSELSIEIDKKYELEKREKEKVVLILAYMHTLAI